ncbi:MAG: glycoside hydrolase family 97 catalytic domain-containing protein [Bacteroidales bacterium]|nr:glycoside hydrolase family 97 catalytic domain-containing protein [Bacteroidales bacterium]
MRLLPLLLLVLAPYAQAVSKPVEVKSPDRSIVLSFDIDSEGHIVYRLSKDKETVIDWSVTGFASSAGSVTNATRLDAGRTVRVRQEWKPLWGKRSIVPDRYNGRDISVTFTGLGEATLQVRVYDDGAAFRFAGLPAGEMTEQTSFNFAGNYTAWFYNGERHNIGPERLSESDGERLPVMTVKAAENRYMAIHEAALSADGWPMRLRSAAGSTSFEVIPEDISANSPFTSAWRVIMCSATPGGLVDSHLLELLNPEPQGDFSWVKPGVCLWDWRIDGAVWDGYHYGMDYDSWTRMIDFAAEQGFSHLVLDANWYGPEFSADSDPVKGDKARDVQRIIAYGRQKGVGVWLYLNDVAGRRYPIEETLAQYEQWGAAGVKYGFMNGTPLEKNRKTQEITALCAKHHLLVDYHDYPVHPFGQMRTWPNAITREYCKAQLDGRQIFQPKTFVTSVFVNMIAGPVDMNNGFMELHQGRTTRKDNNQEVPSTATAEIARTMITWSGATVIPDIPEYYRKYPRLLEFLSAEKQPWKESITLDGRIGEYIVMMRQNADGDYLVAAATNEDARTVDIPLSFLPKGSWNAAVNTDAEDTDYRTNRETCASYDTVVTSSSVLSVRLAPGGGACILLRPQEEK